MTRFATLALAALVTAGLSAPIAATPAAAQKKKKDEKAGESALKLSEEVRKPIAAAQTALAANDTATATAQLAVAEPLAKTDDERYVVDALKLQIVAKGNDRPAMLPMLDRLIANPKTPAADVPRYTYFRGALPFQDKKYAEALPFLNRARELGYTNEDLQLQIAQSMVETGNVAGGVAEIQRAVDAETAAGRKAPESWYSYAVARLFTSGNKAEAATWLQRTIKAYPTTQNWRKVIIVYRDAHEAKGAKRLTDSEQVDLFRLMRATKALAEQGDYFEYAFLTYQAGLPYETKAVIEEGRATGKIPAADARATRLITDAQRAIGQDTPLATLERQAATAANGKTASQTADVYLAQGNFAKAIPLYRLALQKGGVDTSEVNLRLGQALMQSGDQAGAKTAFQAVSAVPRSEIAGFWTQWMEVAPSIQQAAL